MANKSAPISDNKGAFMYHDISSIDLRIIAKHKLAEVARQTLKNLNSLSAVRYAYKIEVLVSMAKEYEGEFLEHGVSEDLLKEFAETSDVFSNIQYSPRSAITGRKTVTDSLGE